MTDYGPQTAHVVALIERLSRLTPNEMTRIADIAIADRAARAYAAERAAWAVSATAGGIEAWTNACTVVADIVASTAAGDAAMALAIRHLIGRFDFARSHYRTLIWPAATVLGPVHPDDQELP